MATTPLLGLHYPAPTDAPDGSGGIYALAADLDTILGGGSWYPTLGGTGAAIGTNSAVSGRYFTVGKHCFAKGYIAFGSGASLGTGVATISGLPVTIDTNMSSGYGWYGANPVQFVPVDGANLGIRPVRSQAAGSLSDLANGYALGTPAQSTILHFILELLSA